MNLNKVNVPSSTVVFTQPCGPIHAVSAFTFQLSSYFPLHRIHDPSTWMKWWHTPTKFHSSSLCITLYRSHYGWQYPPTDTHTSNPTHIYEYICIQCHSIPGYSHICMDVVYTREREMLETWPGAHEVNLLVDCMHADKGCFWLLL